jgi:oligopeptide transport system substrate-binding protein
MKPRRIGLLLGFALLTGTAFTPAPAPETVRLSDYPREETLFYSGGESNDPREYDPATTRGSGNKMVFSGLISLDPQLQLTPELAESWTVKDGTVFTFTLRANASFHDGRAVTAQDVIYSWERAAAPDTQSDTVLTYLGDIVGVREMSDGKSDHISGLRAVDEHTLEVTIDAPKPYFLYKLTYPTAFVLDRANVESGSDWYTHPNGTGPYRLVQWTPRTLIVYERNDDFYLGPPAIRYVVVELYTGIPIRLYESDEIDIAGVYTSDVARLMSPQDSMHDDLQTGVDLCTYYVSFDVTQPPFDDPDIRRAFSLAVDRRQLVDVLYDGAALTAYGLYPPGLPGRREDIPGQSYDPESARAVLAQSAYAGNFPVVKVTDRGWGSYISAEIAALADMWHRTLGITIRVENLQPEKFWDELASGNRGQIWSNGWCADYPDPENFADVLFHTGAEYNDGGYSNPDLDALLEAARIETDPSTRVAMYQQAEDILIEDSPVLFLNHSLSYVLVKPFIEGYVLTPIDIPIERYMSINPDLLP